jgi:hypothetical protein
MRDGAAQRNSQGDAMKKLLPMMVIAVLLAGCVMPISTSVPNQMIQPTLSDAEMQTQIAMVMTAMPTATLLPQLPATNTPAPVVVTATPNEEATQSVPEAASDTPEPAQPSATPAPTEEPSATAGPTETLAPGDPRGHLGSPSATDGMNDSTTWVWPTGNNEYTAVSYGNGLMILTGLTDQLGWRLANPEGAPLGNIYLEASFKTTTCSGSDQYGLVVRVPVLREAEQGYLFGFTCDGKYALRKWDGAAGTKGVMTRLKEWTESDAIKTGSNQVNRMGIMMVGSRLSLYANGQLLTEVSDSSWTSGYFGVYVGASATDDFAIQVDDMAYWKNPTP